MKEVKVSYKDSKRTDDKWVCGAWAITERNCLLKFYVEGLCVRFVRLTEIVKVEIS